LTIISAVTAGKPEYGIGLDLKYDTVSQKASTYAALWWFRKHSRLVLKHATEELEIKSLEVSYYHKINAFSHVGLRAVCDHKANTTSMEVGGDYLWDKNTLLKAKIDTCGNVGLAVARKLNENLKLTFATGVDSKAVTACALHDYKFGFRLDFNQ